MTTTCPMRRLTRRLITAATLVLATLTGCNRGGNRVATEFEPPETGVTFSASKGLRVPPQTAGFIGLQLTDVDERKVTAVFHFCARVYRTADKAQPHPPETLATANLSPSDADRLRAGQTVSVQSDGDEVLTGRIVTIERDLEHANGQVEVLLAIPAADKLAPGAFVSVSAPVQGDRTVITVPRSALLRTTEGDFVYTVSGDHFVRTRIKIGVSDPEILEVADGLYAGDQVVVRPVMTLWLAELQSLRGGKACADGQ